MINTHDLDSELSLIYMHVREPVLHVVAVSVPTHGRTSCTHRSEVEASGPGCHLMKCFPL